MKKEISLFVGRFPGGLVYADRNVMQDGDYKKLAFADNFGFIRYYSQTLPQDIRDRVNADARSLMQECREYLTHAPRARRLGEFCDLFVCPPSEVWKDFCAMSPEDQAEAIICRRFELEQKYGYTMPD